MTNDKTYETVAMPDQPIVDGRFVANRIVGTLLATSGLNLNDIAGMDFTNEERAQFAQLIGYSVSGWSGLSCVTEERFRRHIKNTEGRLLPPSVIVDGVEYVPAEEPA